MELVDVVVATLHLVAGVVATLDAFVRLRMTMRERRSDGDG